MHNIYVMRNIDAQKQSQNLEKTWRIITQDYERKKERKTKENGRTEYQEEKKERQNR